MLQALGQRLSQAREARGLSQAALASQLNMGVEQLGALEAGDLEHLPEAVFVIAQARRLASRLEISIDEEVTSLRQFTEFSAPKINLNQLKFQARGIEQEEPPTSPAEPGPKAKSQTKSSGSLWPGLRTIASLALIAGLATGGTLLWQQWQTQQQLLRQQAIAREASLKKARLEQAKRAAALAIETSQAKQLVLISNEGSWLEVKTTTGKRLFRGAFQGRRAFPLAAGIRVLAGRPDLVLVQRGNGPAKPLGTVKQIRWQTFAPTQAKLQATPAKPPTP
ncbi:helix-turn-helix domain-containing protein [Cyanobium sp. HWJ4-Hawea]|uniref:helix-turn-helix domain-containing protein n=1 Tax=Cyanobium sp. HWJ4-Hawea TaxID=2823713 RepID=UPI0020CBA19F|nr:helix-turn-helix domain-containing protein [Cyanobium sp. HWJ4-Hawea]MCP9807825.1 helix-turn-helix domain-containing protein [Cyanobium sp. HWJ4-Hawea]